MSDGPAPKTDDYYLICPYCDHQYSDAWEWCGDREREAECDECGKTFTCWAERSVTYHSRPTPEETKETQP